jgi:hypothetical protein
MYIKSSPKIRHSILFRLMYTYDFWGGRVTSHYNGCSIFCRSEKTFKMWFIIDLSGKETISEFNILYRIILERGEINYESHFESFFRATKNRTSIIMGRNSPSPEIICIHHISLFLYFSINHIHRCREVYKSTWFYLRRQKVSVQWSKFAVSETGIGHHRNVVDGTKLNDESLARILYTLYIICTT